MASGTISVESLCEAEKFLLIVHVDDAEFAVILQQAGNV